MRKTKEILKLAQETDLTNRQIARSLNVSPTTVGECVKRAEAAGLVWPFTQDMDEEAIEALLYPEQVAGLEVKDLLHPGAGVEHERQERIITPSIGSRTVNRAKKRATSSNSRYSTVGIGMRLRGMFNMRCD